MEEYFTGDAAKLYFRSNGEYFGDKHQRYFMEHAGSHGKISSGQMCEFIKSVGNADLGRIHRLKIGQPLSVRMRRLCMSIAKNWDHMLHDIPGLCCNIISLCLHVQYVCITHAY